MPGGCAHLRAPCLSKGNADRNRRVTTSPRFYNRRDGRWENQAIDFATSTVIHLYGVEVAIMPKNELLTYKAKLDREVDHLDSEEIAAVSVGQE